MDTFHTKVEKLNKECIARLSKQKQDCLGLSDEEMQISEKEEGKQRNTAVNFKTVAELEKEHSGVTITFATPVNIAARREIEERARKATDLVKLRMEAFEKGMKAREEERRKGMPRDLSGVESEMKKGKKEENRIKVDEEEEKVKLKKGGEERKGKLKLEESKAELADRQAEAESKAKLAQLQVKTKLSEQESSLRQAKLDLEKAEQVEREKKAKINAMAKKASELGQKIDQIKNIMAKAREEGTEVMNTAEIVESKDLEDVDLHSEDAEEWDAMDREMEELRREEGWMYICN